MTLNIENLFILQPPSITKAISLHELNRTFHHSIRGNLPFSLRLQFSVNEQAVLARTKQAVAYKIECYARKMQGRELITLAGCSPTILSPQSEPYSVSLPAVHLDIGIYRMQVFLSLEGMEALPTFVEVPVLQVV